MSGIFQENGLGTKRWRSYRNRAGAGSVWISGKCKTNGKVLLKITRIRAVVAE
jgi:hypothetical protein